MSARDKLQDYARENVSLVVEGHTVAQVQRGEIGAKAFVALQNVLDYVEACDRARVRADTTLVRSQIMEGLS